MIKILNKFSYHIYYDFNDDMINRWTEFEKKSNSLIFQKLFFLKNWDSTINKKKKYKLYIVFLYYNNSLIAIIPWCIKKIFSVKTLQWIGEPFNDLNFPILLDKLPISSEELNNVINEILKINKKDFSIVYFEKQIEYFNGKNNIFFNLKNILTTEKHNSLVVNEDLSKLFDKINFFKSQKYKKCLANIKKFNVKYKSTLMSDVDFNFKNDVYNFFLKNKSEKIYKTGAWNYLKLKKNTEFLYLNLKNHKCVCNAIYINDNIISANIGFIDNKTFYYIFPAYDSKWGKISPGLINLYLSIKEILFDKVCDKFDFTIGNETYKNIWSNKTEFLFQSFFATSLRGIFLVPFLYYRYKYSNTTLFKFLKFFYKKIKI